MSKINTRNFSSFCFLIALGMSFGLVAEAQQASEQLRGAPTLTATARVVEQVNASTAQPVGVAPPNKVSAIATNNTKESSSATNVSTNPVEIYRIGSGDVLDIRLVNAPRHISTLYTILAGGLLEFPLIGDQPLNVNDLTTDEIASLLSAELKRRDVNFTPQFVINVRDFASHTVLVNGLVEAQGARVLRREAVPLYVVIAEAMPKRNAGRATIIARATNERRIIDFADSAAMNTLVRAGDVLIVEERPREFFYIAGDVNAAGEKEFRAGITLTQAILAAGGTLRGKVTARIARQNADGRLSFVEYNLQEIEAGSTPDPHLQSGDRIEVGKH